MAPSATLAINERVGALAARGIETSAALCERLLEETGVAILPGTDFGCSERELSARMALVDFDGAALRSCCGRVMEAVEALCGWLGS